MNILHLMKDYKPTNGGSVVRNGNMIDSYRQNYPDDRIFLINLDGGQFESYSRINGVRVYRCTGLKELIKKARKIIREEKIDIIEAHNFRFLFAAFIVRKIHTKIVCEIHALYRMNRLKEIVSYRLLQKSDHIIVLADAAKTYLVKHKKISNNKISVIKNGLDKLDGSLENRESSLGNELSELRKQGKIILAYTGSFIGWQGVRFVADNFDQILGIDDRLVILMVGNGEEYEYVEGKANEAFNSDRIIMHSGISKEEMSKVYLDIDIVFIPREQNLSTDTAVPLKAVEAMRRNKTILASGDDGIREVLNDRNASVYKPGDMDDFVRKLQCLIADSEYRQRIAQKAYIDSGSLFTTWDDNSAKMHEIYHKI